MLAGRIQQGASPQKPASEQTAGLMEALAGNDVVFEGRGRGCRGVYLRENLVIYVVFGLKARKLRGLRGSEERKPHLLRVFRLKPRDLRGFRAKSL